MRGPGRQAALALGDEDADIAGAGRPQGQRFARRKRHAVSGRSRVGLEEERPAGHLRMAGQPAAAPQGEEILPRQGEAAVLREAEAGLGGPILAGSQTLVQDGESCVDERHGMAGGQDESVAEAQPRPADVPAHGSGKEQGQEHVDLGSRATGMPTLAVVELQVYALVHEILEDLVPGEIRLGKGEEAIRLGSLLATPARAGDLARTAAPLCRLSLGRHETAAPLRASTSGSTTARVRRTASTMFSRELA